MATKSIVLAATIATVSLVDSVRLSPALTCFLLLYLAACGQRSMAFKMLVFYAALWGACLALAYGKMTVIVFSPVHFYAAIKTIPSWLRSSRWRFPLRGLSAPRWRRLAFRSA